MPVAKLHDVEIDYQIHEPEPEGLKHKALPILLLHGFGSNQHVNWINTGWTKILCEAGFRVITMDNRGHGGSSKFHSESDYTLDFMAGDAIALLDFLKIRNVHVMGYSMGARISSSLLMGWPDRIGKAVLAGNGYGMVEGSGGWEKVRDGLLASSLDEVVDRRARAFRIFADQTKSDKLALAKCVMGVRQLFTEEQFRRIEHEVLVAIGSDDDVAGSGQKLARLMSRANFFSIKGRDHMRAVGDLTFKREALSFFSS